MLDIKNNYFGKFPEFNDQTRVAGFNVFPVFEEGKRVRRVRTTVLESLEVKARHAAVRAELGLDENLHPISKKVHKMDVEGAAGDSKYYEEALGKTNLSWEEL